MTEVPVELSRVVITENSPEQVIVLKETAGRKRSFPIAIGINEAIAIDRRWKGIQMPRPMTHDLLAGVIEALGGRLERIVVNELRLDSDMRRGTFIATIYIRRGGELIPVDSRPSDAIALGVAFDTPLFVAEEVLSEASGPATDLASQRDSLRARRDRLIEHVAQITRRLEDPQFAASTDDEHIRRLQGHLKDMQAELEAIEEILRQLP